MEKESYYFLFMLIAFVICIGVFWFQFNNDVATFMIINTTEVEENGTIKGVLMDAYSQGVANKTITYHKPGYQMGTLVNTETDENGEFLIENAEYLADAGDENYYGDFTFAGDDRYQGCVYEGNITVIPN
ncbi:hypothetical protein [Methanobrevibacter olleyae]|uniref:Adhesin-like protein n=1 Tax=Methanobrevibacter olleyae TaxID=294671 RepID=A0A126R164_METOL|nr:hypothetical protein [Methanobrevibacter olleyae]AMK16021.1 hypothetical protein YLM1_1464 [Methanobrevibacter olleyae]SFL69325.1 hypothetical protein SAMN02910297_01530 [Methanobrevibacter olleyae]